MTIQYSVAVRNEELKSIEDTVGFSSTPNLTIYSGSVPATAETTVSLGSRLLEMALPTDFFAAPSSGVITKTGSWQGTAMGTGTASFFRLLVAAGDNVGVVQGSVGTSAADLIVDSTSFVTGQIFTVITFTVTHNQG